MTDEFDLERFLAAFPELPPAPRERGRPVVAALQRLRVVLEDEGLQDRLARAMYWPLFEHLRGSGTDARSASTLALRQAKLAVYLMRGYEQREAAEALSVSERTAKSDARQIRAVIRDMRVAATRELPPIPITEGQE